jgi:hypothetical protein
VSEKQARKIVNWESEWLLWTREYLGLNSCRALVKWACDLYDVKYPKVSQHHKPHYSLAIPKKNLISMWVEQRNHAIVLHEAAHHILHELHGNDFHDHGPEWLGIYMYLLEQAKLAPKIALTSSALEHGLVWKEMPP